jgi:RNA polymerase sigma-70 factor (ECF subfamily)
VNAKAAALNVGIAERSGSDTLVRARRGDLAAFEQIVRQHERTVFRLAWRLLGNADDAADAAQEVFLKLYRGIDSIDEARELGPWLYRVTVNAATDLHRRRRPGRPLDDVVIATPGPTPEQALLEGQRHELARRALDLLPPKERAAIVLRDIEGLTTSEVAETLGSSETTVRSQISSARVKLKRILDGLLTRRRT